MKSVEKSLQPKSVSQNSWSAKSSSKPFYLVRLLKTQATITWLGISMPLAFNWSVSYLTLFKYSSIEEYLDSGFEKLFADQEFWAKPFWAIEIFQQIPCFKSCFGLLYLQERSILNCKPYIGQGFLINFWFWGGSFHYSIAKRSVYKKRLDPKAPDFVVGLPNELADWDFVCE